MWYSVSNTLKTMMQNKGIPNMNTLQFVTLLTWCCAAKISYRNANNKSTICYRNWKFIKWPSKRHFLEINIISLRSVFFNRDLKSLKNGNIVRHILSTSPSRTISKLLATNKIGQAHSRMCCASSSTHSSRYIKHSKGKSDNRVRHALCVTNMICVQCDRNDRNIL